MALLNNYIFAIYGGVFLNYNKSSKESIEIFARELLNKNLINVLGEDLNYRLNNKKSKGRLGQIVEENYFGYQINSNKEADFKEAGLELKVAPLKQIKPKNSSTILREKSGLSAKERLVLSIINFNEVYNEQWENNSLFDKCKDLLLMFYMHNPNVKVEELIFRIISIWTPPEEDLNIIKKDWELIISKIRQGKAHEISEGDTLYLGACTKGSTAEKSKRQQPFSDILAPQRAFCFKRAYVDFIIEELLQREQYLKLKKEKSISQSFEGQAFDEVIINIFKSLEGKQLKEIIDDFNITRERKAKNFIRLVIDDICKLKFGEKLENLSEFKKANIELKTIVLQSNNVPKESMSFEQINFCEIINEDWEHSTIREKFENKKHLWIIFKSDISFKKQSEIPLDSLKLYKVMFWNMPIRDLEGPMYDLWKDTTDKIRIGVYDKFITSKENKVGHIRPKAISVKDLMKTPQGTFEKKKCFWLNSKYIAEQIEKEVSVKN